MIYDVPNPTAKRRNARNAEKPEEAEAFDAPRMRALEALRDGAAVAEAAEAAGVRRNTLWRWRQADEAFALAYHDAEEHGTDTLEKVARKRAVEGSDTLLIFLLKARRPAMYRDSVKIDATVTSRDPGIREAAGRDPELFERLSRLLAESKQA